MCGSDRLSIEIWQRMLRTVRVSASILLIIPYSATNRKALGCFKDELNSVPMQQVVGLRPTCYAFLCTDKVCNNVFQHTRPIERKTAKGVRRSVKDAHLHLAHYLDALNNFRTYLCRQNLIKSSSHTVRQN